LVVAFAVQALRKQGLGVDRDDHVLDLGLAGRRAYGTISRPSLHRSCRLLAFQLRGGSAKRRRMERGTDGRHGEEFFAGRAGASGATDASPRGRGGVKRVLAKTGERDRAGNARGIQIFPKSAFHWWRRFFSASQSQTLAGQSFELKMAETLASPPDASLSFRRLFTTQSRPTPRRIHFEQRPKPYSTQWRS
jgi:hypothetical protein